MKILYIQPYDKNSPPNIGGAINSAILQLNADSGDWICLLDHDVMFLLPDSKKQLEQILETTDYDILGPITNRLGAKTQLVPGMFDVTDIAKHISVAKDFSATYYNEVVSIRDPLAAFCLCFRVSTWEKLGRFPENNLSFDWLFSERAIREGMKLGLMTGIYVFHSYRLFSNKEDYSHLL